MRATTLAILLATSSALSAGCIDLIDPGEELDEAEVTAVPKIMLNKIMLNKIMLNALTGVPEYLQLLIDSPLSTETFAGPLGEALADPDALELMPYLVGCALGENSPPVQWDDPWDVTGSHEWHGSAGLCTSWAVTTPSSMCLQAVSACLLARENAEGVSVATSHRGQYWYGPAFALANEVPAKTSGLDGQLIASYQPCKRATSGDKRNCGWSAKHSWVGTCQPEAKVTLSCTQGTNSVVRVCKGVGGCNSTTALASASNACAGAAVEFNCPGTGTYAVMAGPAKSSSFTTIWGVDLAASSGSFPASEPEVFGVREGHFYGTLFEPGQYNELIHIDVDTNGPVPVFNKVVDAVSAIQVFQKASVCADLEWDDPDAYMSHRLCAVLTNVDGEPIEACVAGYQGRCNVTPTNDAANLCAAVDGGPVLGDGDFDGCEGNGQTWNHGITVFLNQPCDLLAPADHADCKRR